jgi:hypothetical protein
MALKHTPLAICQRSPGGEDALLRNKDEGRTFHTWLQCATRVRGQNYDIAFKVR